MSPAPPDARMRPVVLAMGGTSPPRQGGRILRVLAAIGVGVASLAAAAGVMAAGTALWQTVGTSGPDGPIPLWAPPAVDPVGRQPASTPVPYPSAGQQVLGDTDGGTGPTSATGSPTGAVPAGGGSMTGGSDDHPRHDDADDAEAGDDHGGRSRHGSGGD